LTPILAFRTVVEPLRNQVSAIKSKYQHGASLRDSDGSDESSEESFVESAESSPLGAREADESDSSEHEEGIASQRKKKQRREVAELHSDEGD
jgi:hypothetical protein